MRRQIEVRIFMENFSLLVGLSVVRDFMVGEVSENISMLHGGRESSTLTTVLKVVDLGVWVLFQPLRGKIITELMKLSLILTKNLVKFFPGKHRDSSRELWHVHDIESPSGHLFADSLPFKRTLSLEVFEDPLSYFFRG